MSPKQYLKDNPKIDIIHGTSDGNLFFAKGDAVNHAKTLEDKFVNSVDRSALKEDKASATDVAKNDAAKNDALTDAAKNDAAKNAAAKSAAAKKEAAKKEAAKPSVKNPVVPVKPDMPADRIEPGVNAAEL